MIKKSKQGRESAGPLLLARSLVFFRYNSVQTVAGEEVFFFFNSLDWNFIEFKSLNKLGWGVLSDWQWWSSFPLKPTGVTWPATRQCRNLAFFQFWRWDFFILSLHFSLHYLGTVYATSEHSSQWVSGKSESNLFSSDFDDQGVLAFFNFFTMLRFCLLSLHLLPMLSW